MKKKSNFQEILLPFNKRDKAIDEIVRFFEEERGEQLGVIVSENFLNFILENIGKDIYAKAVDDSKEILNKRFEDIELDLDILKNI